MNAPTPPKTPGAGPAQPAEDAPGASGGLAARGRLTPVAAPAPGAPGPAVPAPAPDKGGKGPPAAPGAGTPPVARPKKTLPTPQPSKGSGAVRPPVPRSRLRRRHLAVVASFVVLVVLPVAVSAWYLWARAADQYASYVGFSVRREEASSAIESVLGPLNLSGSSTSDTDILYEFIQSQNLVARIDGEIDLREIWSSAGPDRDPVFAYRPPGTIEDLLGHWERMVKIYYDSGTGLIELMVLAFAPEDAQRIAQRIFDESTAMINELSAIAREDAIRYARDELTVSVERLKSARQALTEFRNRTQIVDPSVDLQSQAGLLSTLNQQLAQALIELDLLRETTRANDPRIAQAERRIKVIEDRIEEEKKKLGFGGSGTGEDADAFATLVGEYERLLVDREFAEEAYKVALAAYDAAQAEARRQSRYLAAHVRPTLAERPEYPERGKLLVLIAVFLCLSWAVLVLIGYSIKDRR